MAIEVNRMFLQKLLDQGYILRNGESLENIVMAGYELGWPVEKYIQGIIDYNPQVLIKI